MLTPEQEGYCKRNSGIDPVFTETNVLTVISGLLFIAITGSHKIIRPKITFKYDADDRGVNSKISTCRRVSTIWQ
jgi:hypothetical protein